MSSSGPEAVRPAARPGLRANAARATATESRLSDLPRARSRTARTRPPRAGILKRPHSLALQARRPDQQAREPASPHRNRLPPHSPPVAAAIVCERLWVPAPSTIIDPSTPPSRPCWTSGGHGLLGAVPRSDQVTPDIPDRRRATQHRKSRPPGPTASKRVSSPPGRDHHPHVGRHRQAESKQQASKQKRGCRAGGVDPGTRNRGDRRERIHAEPARRSRREGPEAR